METIYETIKKNALPHIESYLNDLDIDKKIIDENPGIPFIHFTGKNGTDIELLPPYDHESYPPKGEKIPYLFGFADREHILRQKREVLSCYKSSRNELIQYYDGRKVKKIPFVQSVLIIRAYTENILNSWNRKK